MIHILINSNLLYVLSSSANMTKRLVMIAKIIYYLPTTFLV